MKEKINKVVEFAKAHEKELCLTGKVVGAVALVVGGVFLGKQIHNVHSEWREIDIPDWNIGENAGIIVRDGKDIPDYTIAAAGVKIADLGKLGEELYKLGGVDRDSYTEVMLYVGEKTISD